MEASQTLKIAAVTDDGRTISTHFGRARAYLVCTVVLARGMGRGAYLALEQAGLEPFVTAETSIAEAVRAYLGGELVNHTERLH